MKKHLNLIHFSRALVPLFVILFHAEDMLAFYFNYDFLKLSSVTKSGGVYYFFTLSGFMIYYLYKNSFGKPDKLKRFLYGRFIKIYPLYLIITLCIFLIYLFIPSIADGHETDISKVVTSLLLLPHEYGPTLGVSWSLVHTVFFYLIVSVAFLENKKLSLIILTLWSIISLLFSLKILTASHFLINFIFNYNNLIFLFGIGCAFIVTRIKINYYLSLVFIFIGLVGFPMSWFNTQYSVVDINLQVTTSFSSILIILGLASIDLQREIPLPKLAKYLGDASYSIYLTNFVSMYVLCIIISKVPLLTIPYTILGLILIFFSLVVGCIVYSFIERPLLYKLKNLHILEKKKVKINQLNILVKDKINKGTL